MDFCFFLQFTIGGLQNPNFGSPGLLHRNPKEPILMTLGCGLSVVKTKITIFMHPHLISLKKSLRLINSEPFLYLMCYMMCTILIEKQPEIFKRGKLKI